MKAYVDARSSALFWTGVCAVLGIVAVMLSLDMKNGKAVDRALVAQEKATHVAFEAAEAKGIQHNGLIERMREMSGTYITRANLYSALIAAGVVVTIYSQFRGAR